MGGEGYVSLGTSLPSDDFVVFFCVCPMPYFHAQENVC